MTLDNLLLLLCQSDWCLGFTCAARCISFWYLFCNAWTFVLVLQLGFCLLCKVMFSWLYWVYCLVHCLWWEEIDQAVAPPLSCAVKLTTNSTLLSCIMSVPCTPSHYHSWPLQRRSLRDYILIMMLLYLIAFICWVGVAFVCIQCAGMPVPYDSMMHLRLLWVSQLWDCEIRSNPEWTELLARHMRSPIAHTRLPLWVVLTRIIRYGWWYYEPNQLACRPATHFADIGLWHYLSAQYNTLRNIAPAQ